jgi:hypothetical protein
VALDAAEEAAGILYAAEEPAFEGLVPAAEMALWSAMGLGEGL